MAVTMTGARHVPVGRELVWAALNDEQSLRACIPGCRSLTRTSDTTFDICVPVRLGPVHVAFNGAVEVFDTDPPAAYSMRGTGCGGILGQATGTTRIKLTALPNGCRLSYAVEAEASGPLSALGTLFLAGVAKTMTDQFVTALVDLLSGRGESAPDPFMIGAKAPPTAALQPPAPVA